MAKINKRNELHQNLFFTKRNDETVWPRHSNMLLPTCGNRKQMRVGVVIVLCISGHFHQPLILDQILSDNVDTKLNC